MNHPLTASALFTGLLLGACATPAPTPPALVEARSTLQSAELDPKVLANAPLELKKATESLNRANVLHAKGEAADQVNSAAYIANQQARTAMAIAGTKDNEAAIRGAELDRERARADIRSIEAQRAQAQASTAQAQTGVARQQAAAAEQRASGAEQRASGAEQRASGAEQRATGAEQQSAVAQAGAIEARQQTEQLQQRLSELQAQQTERGTLVTLGDVLFEFNRAEVKPGAQASLRKLSDFLQQYPSRRILIEGHTDNVGSTANNQTLSRRRADAVNAALVGMGLNAQRADSVGYGELYPIADNVTDTNRALNRRVEVYIAEANQPVRARR